MKKLLLVSCLIFFSVLSYGQAQEENAIYIIDSIPILRDVPAEDAYLSPDEVDHLVVLRNKDSLRLLGYEKMDVAYYVFTKAYVNRPEEIKKIPSSLRMTRENGLWCMHGSPYTGPFIDYHFNGSKEGEGTFKDGLVNGPRVKYFKNGHKGFETNYVNGVQNGMEAEYYENGVLRQKGDFRNGAEDGVWEKYFPNGQVKQHSVFENGKMTGEVLIYYSSGRLKARERIKNGKIEPDPALEKISKLYEKGVEAGKNGNHKLAYKHYTKCIEIDSNYAEAYFARGTARLNEQQFDAAIADYDKALQLEPYFEYALYNRAISLIQKYQTSRTLSTNQYITVMAAKGKEVIPPQAYEKICSDLRAALLLDPGSEKVKKMIEEYCK